MLEYNTPLFKVVYYDNHLKQTVIKNKVFIFTVDRIIEQLKQKKINNLTITML